MFSKISNITYFNNENLSKYCSFQIGGKAKYLILAHNIDALLDVVFTCQQHSIKFKIIGGGSNLLFDDLGFNGAIIKYVDEFIKIKDNSVYTSAGVSLSHIIQKSKQHNIGGLEFTVGVPCSVGGAIVNNFGAYNHNISDYLEHITVLRNKQIIYLTPDECNFDYHSSIFQNNEDIVLSAVFNLPNQDRTVTQYNSLQYYAKRSSSQPLNLPNAGSIFKRTENIIPAKLIDEAGLKGLRVGNAQVSTKHAGFIVNLGGASCKDIKNLINLIIEKIYIKYSIKLTKEIEFVKFN